MFFHDFVDEVREECINKTVTKCIPKFGEHLVGSRVIVMTKNICHDSTEKKCSDVTHRTCVDVPKEVSKPFTKTVPRCVTVPHQICEDVEVEVEKPILKTVPRCVTVPHQICAEIPVMKEQCAGKLVSVSGIKRKFCQITHTYFRYTFLSNHIVHKSFCGLYFQAPYPLIDRLSIN